MGNQFEIFDVYGRRVYCSTGMWFGKLCGPNRYLPEDEILVQRAIRDPEDGYPRYDKEYPKKNRRVYYRMSPNKDFYAKVVVEFHTPDNGMIYGNVVTGYPETTMDSRELPEERP